jgi:serine/threonine-protein kinase RIO1
LEEKGYPDPPVVKPIAITDSHKIFNDENTKNGKTVFTMPRFSQGSFAEAEGSELYKDNLDYLYKVVNYSYNLGFIIEDVIDSLFNILMKDDKPYIADCGNCMIKENSPAHHAFEKVAKEQGFEMSQFDEFIEESLEIETSSSNACTDKTQSSENKEVESTKQRQALPSETFQSRENNKRLKTSSPDLG